MPAILIPAILFTLMLGVAALLYGSSRSAELSHDREMLRRLGGVDLPSLPGGYQDAIQLAKRGLRSRGAPTSLGKLEEAISRAGLNLSARLFLLVMIVLFGTGASAAAAWFGLTIALAVGAASGSLPLFYLRFRHGQRLKAFNRQLPYVLDLLRSALESGHTLLRGLQMASENLGDPMCSEIRLVLEQVQLGMPLPPALESMYRRIPEEDLGFLVVAVKIQSAVGSSLAEILQHVTASVRNRQRLKDQIQTLTAQSRMSATIVSVLPAVILLAFTFIRPGYAGPLFYDPIGIKLLETAIFLDVLALVLMRRIAQVKY
jgi:tight adherence protein B